MSPREITDEQALARYNAFVENGHKYRAAALSLGMGRNGDKAIRRGVEVAMQRGLHLSAGVRATLDRARINPTEARGGWIHDYDADGKKVGTTRWAAPEIDLDAFRDQVATAFADIEPAALIAPPGHCDSDLLTTYPIADAHIGMMAWGKETGEDYDTSIACQRLTQWIARAVASSPPSETAIILDVGDLTHADDQTNQTPRSKHNLDNDTRYFKTVDMTIAALASAIECAAQKHSRVIVRILPGNHNPHSYVGIVMALAERYRDNPRVKVEKNPSEFFVRQFGRVMLAAHHGDKAKAERMVLFMADEFPEIWGNTRHRYLFTGHLHHHKSQDIGGVQWEQLRALTSKDAYAASHAYSARAQLQAITYHREHGEVSRVKVSNCA